MMKKNFLTMSFAGFAFFGVVATAFAAGASDVWFHETAETFEENVGGRWSGAPGVAVRSGARIQIRNVGNAASHVDNELRYTPLSPAANKGFYTIENRMSFDSFGSLAFDTHGGFIGIQLVPKSGAEETYVFALLDSGSGETIWAETEVVGEANVDYDIRIELDYTLGSESASYSYRLAGTGDYLPIATVRLPVGAKQPDQFVYSGRGGLVESRAESAAENPDRYSRWNAGNAIVTWEGTGTTATVSINGKSVEFRLFSKAADGVWIDDPTTSWMSTATYSSLPGYSGVATYAFYKTLSSSYKPPYAAPGLTLRFKPNTGKYVSTLGGTFALSLFGLIVEPGATGYSLVQTGSGRTTTFGDSRGLASGRLEIGENFTIRRYGDVTLYGANDLIIADGRTFDLNSASAGFVVKLDAATAGELRLYGKGTLKVLKMSATGGVTLGFAGQSVHRATPYIMGDLVVDEKTSYVFPPDLKPNVGYPLCSGELTAPTAPVLASVTAENAVRLARLSYAGNAVSYETDLSAYSTTPLTVPDGCEAEIVGSEDPARPLVWSGDLDVQGTLVVHGYVLFTGSFNVTGEVIYNGQYASWKSNPALFTWASALGDFRLGEFLLFDTEAGADTDVSFLGDKPSDEIPGREGDSVPAFWQIFSSARASVAPGYALRFARDVGSPAALDASFSPLNLGGLVVESGASGYGFESPASADRRETVLGDPTGRTPCRIDLSEDFSFRRAGDATLCGDLSVFVSAGHSLTLDPRGVGSLTLDDTTQAKLRLQGDGRLVATTGLIAKGAVTLDFSALSLTRPQAFLDCALTVDETTSFALPVGASGSYKLCTGTLTAPTGTALKALRIGDEMVLADVSFDPANCQIRWTVRTSVNTATVASDLTWGEIAWAGGAFVSGRPGIITIDRDVRITFDSTISATIPALLVRGSGTATFVLQRQPPVGLFAASGAAAAYELAIPHSSDFNRSRPLVVTNGVSVVLEGPAGATAWTWAGNITVHGVLKTKGTIDLTNTENVIADDGRLEVVTGRLSMTGAANGLRGDLTVDADARFVNARTEDFVDGTSASRIVVKGELALGETNWKLGPRNALELVAGGVVSGEGLADRGALDLQGLSRLGVGAADGQTTAILSARLRYGTEDGFARTIEMPIESGAQLRVTGARSIHAGSDYAFRVTGGGSLALADGVTMSFCDNTFCTGGLSGTGTAIFLGDPSSSGISASLRDISSWKGVVSLVGTRFGGSGFNPDDWGNAASHVRLSAGCSGFFARGTGPTTVPIELVAVEGYEFALSAFGYAGDSIELTRVLGDGGLEIPETAGSGGCRVYLPNLEGFTGSLSVGGGSNASAIRLGVAKAEGTESAGEYAGKIVVASGLSPVIGAGAVWSAAGGVLIPSDVTVTVAGGAFGRGVVGEGTVRYVGAPVGKPEAVALFTDETAWYGTVRFDSAEVTACNLAAGGNMNSKLVFKDSIGTIAGGNSSAQVVFEGAGLVVTGAVSGAETSLKTIAGTGAFDLACGADAPTVRIYDATDYTGALTIRPGCAATILLGDAERTLDGAIEVADGYVIPANRNWSAPTVKFGPRVTVAGPVGSTVLRATGSEPGNYEDVAVTLDPDPSAGHVRAYALELDGDTKYLQVVARRSEPELVVSDTRFVYGTDMATAAVTITVSNFWEGVGYSGGVYARAIVRDADGNVVDAVGTKITGNGDIVLGSVPIRNGAASDYTCEIVIEAYESESSENKTVLTEAAFADNVTHLSGGKGWIRENAATFVSTVPAEKTGTWTYPAGGAVAEDGEIRIGTESETVDFTANRTSTNDVIMLTLRMYASVEYGAKSGTPGPAAKAAVSVRYDEETDAHSYYLWNPGEGRFEDCYGSGEKTRPLPGNWYDIACTINYRSGTVTYAVDGFSLTNADGVAFFPLKPEQIAVRGVGRARFSGFGGIARLDGDERDAHLAQTVIAGVTNVYDNVDDAVLAALEGGVTNVTLLWDASWRPLTNDIGKTIAFDLGGHALSIDPAATNSFAGAGYQVVDHGGGSFSIDPITYWLSFESNGGEGAMEPLPFSVTNRVLTLSPNAFTRTGHDFVSWNLLPDGSGAESWADGATIDLGPYGLGDLSLYAQWDVSRRIVTVAPATDYVYVELVTTNAPNANPARHDGVRFYTDRSASFDVLNGTEIVVRFSTDIERALNFDRLGPISVTADRTFPADLLPTNMLAAKLSLAPPPSFSLSPVQYWAATRGITTSQLGASRYVGSSYALDALKLLDEGETEVRISDFTVGDDSCSFRVTIDGRTVTSEAVARMVQVSGDLVSWRPADADAVSVEGERVTVRTDANAKFVKIVVPKD